MEERIEFLEKTFSQLRLEVHIGLVLVLLVVSSLYGWTTLTIGRFAEIFEDMLGGKALPVLTSIVIDLQIPLILLAFLFPLIGIALAFAHRRIPGTALGILGLIAIVIVLRTIITTALSAPLHSIITSLTEGNL